MVPDVAPAAPGWMGPVATVEPVRITGLDEVRIRMSDGGEALEPVAEVVPGDGDLAAVILVDHQLRVRIYHWARSCRSH